MQTGSTILEILMLAPFWVSIFDFSARSNLHLTGPNLQAVNQLLAACVQGWGYTHAGGAFVPQKRTAGGYHGGPESACKPTRNRSELALDARTGHGTSHSFCASEANPRCECVSAQDEVTTLGDHHLSLPITTE